jgi:hypothetical protein
MTKAINNQKHPFKMKKLQCKSHVISYLPDNNHLVSN